MGQPGRGSTERDMSNVLLRPEDQEMFGQGQPPNVYPEPPQWQGGHPGYGGHSHPGLPQGQPPPGGQAPNVIGRSPYGGWGQGGPQLDPTTNQYRTQPVGQPQQLNQGTPPQAPPGYNFGGDSTGYQSPYMNSPQAGGQNYAGLQQAVAQSIQNGYTDIGRMREYFKPGQFQGQLSGFNTGGWGTGERGTDTLKNMMGTIFSNFDVTQPGALQSALPEIHKALPNATISGPKQDLIDPDGPNGPMAPVDVIQSAGENGAGIAWAWQPTDQSASPLSGPGGPSQQAYLSGMPGQQIPQPGSPFSMTGGPQVGDQNSAMQFLQWLMQQQQQGQLPQYNSGNQSGVYLP